MTGGAGGAVTGGAGGADELLAPGGECVVCKQLADERVMIAAVEVGSGAGAILYGCLPCARVRARSPFAAEWLAADLAVIDAERAT